MWVRALRFLKTGPKGKLSLSTQELAGVIVPINTPVDAEDRVDEPALRRVVRRLIAAAPLTVAQRQALDEFLSVRA